MLNPTAVVITCLSCRRYQEGQESQFHFAVVDGQTAFSFVLAILTPPKAGPFCVENCVGYPYTDGAR